MAKLTLDRDQIDKCRQVAEHIIHPLQKYIDLHSTKSVERATLRLLGLNQDWHDKKTDTYEPMANIIVDQLNSKQLSMGVCTWIAAAKQKMPRLPLSKLAIKIINGSIDITKLQEPNLDLCQKSMKDWVQESFKKMDATRRYREKKRQRSPSLFAPLRSVCVGSGNIHDDVEMANHLANSGADIIHIKSNPEQKSFHSIPHGATTQKGKGLTLSQTNLKILREALDQTGQENKKYIRLSLDTHSLCMPEIAVMSIEEGVDFVLNDCLSGVFESSINLKRFFIDQYFTRLVLGRSGMVVHTQSLNLSSDLEPLERIPFLIASQFINEQLAKNAGLREDQLALAYKNKIDLNQENCLLIELAQSQLIRELFPKHPVKLEANSEKNSDQKIHLLQMSLYHLIGALTNQSVQEIQIPDSDGPSHQDYAHALQNAKQVYQVSKSLYDDVRFKENGPSVRHARTILDDTLQFLEKVDQCGFMESIEQKLWRIEGQNRDAGIGLDGIFQKNRKYFNPYFDRLSSR